jgi:hypothetical protein
MNPSMEPGAAAVVDSMDNPTKSPQSFSQPYFVFRNVSLNGHSAIEKIMPLINCNAGPATIAIEFMGFIKPENGGVSNNDW